MKCLHVSYLCFMLFGLLSSAAHAEIIPGKSLYAEVDNKDHLSIVELSSDMSNLEVFPDGASKRDFTIVIKARRLCQTKSVYVSPNESTITIACNASADADASGQELPGVYMPNIVPGIAVEDSTGAVIRNLELLNAR